MQRHIPFLLAAVATFTSQCNAQISQVTGEGQATFDIRPHDCLRVRLGSRDPERALFGVTPRLPPSEFFASSCSGLAVRQALPQNEENFALAAYDDQTECYEVIVPTKRPSSYGRDVSLSFVDVAAIQLAEVPYHVCTDATWSNNLGTQGPVDTFLWFHNPCHEVQSVSVTVSRIMEDEDAEDYCRKLETQNEGHITVMVIASAASIISLLSVAVGATMLTGCCSCWCCCARPGMCSGIATPATKACFRNWSAVLSKVGFGWVTGRSGGIQFYTEQQSRAVLFWTFAATVMSTILSTNYPQFYRDDSLDPRYQDSRTTWGVLLSRGVPFSENPTADFGLSLLWAAGAAIATYLAIVMTFSDPLRDPSFRSKSIICGVLLVSTLLHTVVALLDTWRYLHLWPLNTRSHQFTVQYGVIVAQAMSVVSYFQFVYDAFSKQHAVRTANSGKLPDLIDTSEITARFTALKKPQSLGLDSETSAASMPPVARVAFIPISPVFPYRASLANPCRDASQPLVANSRGTVHALSPAKEEEEADTFSLPVPPSPSTVASSARVEEADSVCRLPDPPFGTAASSARAEEEDSLFLGPGPPSVAAASSARVEEEDSLFLGPGPPSVAAASSARVEEEDSFLFLAGPPRAGPVGEAIVDDAQQVHVRMHAPQAAAALETVNAPQAAWASVRVGGEPVKSQPISEVQMEESETPRSECPQSAEEQAKQRTLMMMLMDRLRDVWESVREDSQIGFKYSPFVSASLLVTFVINTAAFLRALNWVRDVAECTQADSSCLTDIQLWLYKLIIKDLVRVDAVALELWARGFCKQVATGSLALLDVPLPSHILSTEVAERCSQTASLETLQLDREYPEWLRDSKFSILMGGHVGFTFGYCLTLYTIVHVAISYKKLELKLRAARIAELLEPYQNAATADVASAVPPSSVGSSNRTAASKASSGIAGAIQLGKDVIADYKTVRIGQSAYFTGALLSTCYVQMWLSSLLVGSVVALVTHSQLWIWFWEGELNVWWPLRFACMIVWHITSQVLLNTYVTDGKRIKRPFVWLFSYVALSAAYCVVAVLIALGRVIILALTSIIGLSRLDKCLFTVVFVPEQDRAYSSFLAMTLMLHSFKECLKENKLLDARDRSRYVSAEKLRGRALDDSGPADTSGPIGAAVTDSLELSEPSTPIHRPLLNE